MIKNKFKKQLSELKKFEAQTILVLQYKKRNYFKIFHLCAKLIASNSDTDEAFKFMYYQSIMTKIKNCASEDWIVLDVFIKHSIKIFKCQYSKNKQYKKWR